MSEPKGDSGLSVRTLAISAVASLVAALVVREIWGPGAIIGAAVTPVIVALVQESINRPAQRVSTLTQRRTRTDVHRTPGGTRIEAPPQREDRFGIWEESRPRGLDRRHVRIGIVTGLVAFVLVAVVLTSSELVFGGSVTGGSKTTVFGGKKRSSKSKDAGKPAQTTTQTSPAQTTPAPAQTAPETVPETTPTTPPETTPAPPTTPSETVPDGTATPTPGGEQAPPG